MIIETTTLRSHIGWISLGALMVCAQFAGCSDDEPGPVGNPWTPAFEAQDVGWLLSIWGPSGDDLYAVGGAPDEGVLMRYDGTAWNAVALDVDVPLLNWAYGFSSNDVVIVGNSGTVIRGSGTSWEIQTTTTTQDLWGVWGAAPDDIWAVGGSGRADGEATLLHYDGTSWRKMPIPELQRPNVFAFFKVWGTAADDVYVVGQRGVVLHYDGSEWTEQLVGTSEDLISLWGTGPDRIAIVGGRNNGQIVTWNGTDWTQQSLSPLPGLNGIWMGDPNVVHLAGVNGTLATLDFDTLTYTEESPDGVRLDFHAIFGDAKGRLTAVGGNFLQLMGPYEGVAFEREID